MMGAMAGPVVRRTQRLFWDVHSRTWDDLVDVPAVAAHRAELVDWLLFALPPGSERVVDLGCATGELAIRLAAAGVDVVGLDFSPPMVARARAKAAAAEVGARFDVADLSRPLPLSSSTCRGALCVYVLQVVPDPSGLLAEVRRVLRPDGVVLFDVPRPGHGRRRPPGGLLHRPFWLAKRALVRTGQAALRYDPEQLVTAIAAAGFQLLERRSFPESLGVLAAPVR